MNERKEKELRPCLDTPPETIACVLPIYRRHGTGDARGKKGPGWIDSYL